jgi:hypothetical protein
MSVMFVLCLVWSAAVLCSAALQMLLALWSAQLFPAPAGRGRSQFHLEAARAVTFSRESLTLSPLFSSPLHPWDRRSFPAQ